MDNSIFENLSNVELEKYIKKKDNLSYVSWANAWAEVAKRYPKATYEIRHWDGAPYFSDGLGYMVEVSVTIDDLSHTMWLPVMDSHNRAMKAEPYTTKTKYGKEITVPAATMMDVNKTIMRALVKCLAMFGLGLYIYAGEDIPEDEEKENDKSKKASESVKAEKERQEALNSKITLAMEKDLADRIGDDKILMWFALVQGGVKDLSDMTVENYRRICDGWEKFVESAPKMYEKAKAKKEATRGQN